MIFDNIDAEVRIYGDLLGSSHTHVNGMHSWRFVEWTICPRTLVDVPRLRRHIHFTPCYAMPCHTMRRTFDEQGFKGPPPNPLRESRRRKNRGRMIPRHRHFQVGWVSWWALSAVVRRLIRRQGPVGTGGQMVWLRGPRDPLVRDPLPLPTNGAFLGSMGRAGRIFVPEMPWDPREGGRVGIGASLVPGGRRSSCPWRPGPTPPVAA